MTESEAKNQVRAALGQTAGVPSEPGQGRLRVLAVHLMAHRGMDLETALATARGLIGLDTLTRAIAEAGHEAEVQASLAAEERYETEQLNELDRAAVSRRQAEDNEQYAAEAEAEERDAYVPPPVVVRTITVSTWGRLGLGDITVRWRSGEESQVEAAVRSICRRRRLSAWSACPQGTSLRDGRPESHHYSMTLGRYVDNHSMSVAGEIWFAVPV